jgi:hypothetical protein
MPHRTGSGAGSEGSRLGATSRRQRCAAAQFLSTIAAASVVPSGLPRPALAQRGRMLRFVPQADLSSLDPIWTTSNVTRNFGYMVYDQLYGSDAAFRPRPQMAEATSRRTGAGKSRSRCAPGSPSTTASRCARGTASPACGAG